MDDKCPTNPDILLREITMVRKRTLAIWGIISIIIVIGILFVAYTMVQDISDWYAENRVHSVKLKGRNNVFDSKDDKFNASDYSDDFVSEKVVRIIQSYVMNVNKFRWLK